MLTEIEVKKNDSKNLLLPNDHIIRVNHLEDGTSEVVIYPWNMNKVTVRYSPEPYQCYIYFADGSSKLIDLSCEDDWGNINYAFEHIDNNELRKYIGYGNDADGYSEIVRIKDMRGVDILLTDFMKDVKDFSVYFEA